MPNLWTQGGKVIVDGSGSPVVCGDCPCGCVTMKTHSTINIICTALGGTIFPGCATDCTYTISFSESLLKISDNTWQLRGNYIYNPDGSVKGYFEDTLTCNNGFVTFTCSNVFLIDGTCIAFSASGSIADFFGAGLVDSSCGGYVSGSY